MPSTAQNWSQLVLHIPVDTGDRPASNEHVTPHMPGTTLIEVHQQHNEHLPCHKVPCDLLL